MWIADQGISFRNLAKLSDEVGRHDDLEFLQKLIDVADMDNDGRVRSLAIMLPSGVLHMHSILAKVINLFCNRSRPKSSGYT